MLVTIKVLGHTHELTVENGNVTTETGEVYSLHKCIKEFEFLTDEFLRLDGWIKLRDNHRVKWHETK
jgi:hypothetical protein